VTRRVVPILLALVTLAPACAARRTSIPSPPPVWTETVTNIRDVEFLAFPRVAEVAEIGWSPAASRRWEEFRGRLGAQAPRWSALGVNFYRSPQVPWTP
jgi:hypothetical protein